MFFLFDFDGVLIDSVREAALSAYNAVTKNNFRSLEAAPKACLDLFYNNRFIFYKPGNLYLLMQWCVENYQQRPDYILSKEEFKEYVEKDKRSLVELGEYFYSVRCAFMDSEPEKWTKINYPFEPMWSALKSYGCDKFLILTAKNKAAVKMLTLYYDLKIPEENIYSGDGGKNKIENFKDILKRLPDKQFYFVDDHLINLVELDKAFNTDNEKLISFGLADWGYGWRGDLEIAKKNGYEVLNQNELISKFK